MNLESHTADDYNKPFWPNTNRLTDTFSDNQGDKKRLFNLESDATQSMANRAKHFHTLRHTDPTSAREVRRQLFDDANTSSSRRRSQAFTRRAPCEDERRRAPCEDERRRAAEIVYRTRNDRTRRPASVYQCSTVGDKRVMEASPLHFGLDIGEKKLFRAPASDVYDASRLSKDLVRFAPSGHVRVYQLKRSAAPLKRIEFVGPQSHRKYFNCSRQLSNSDVAAANCLTFHNVNLRGRSPLSTGHKRERLRMRDYRLQKWTQTSERSQQQTSVSMKNGDGSLISVNSKFRSRSARDRAQSNLAKVKAVLSSADSLARNRDPMITVSEHTCANYCDTKRSPIFPAESSSVHVDIKNKLLSSFPTKSRTDVEEICGSAEKKSKFLSTNNGRTSTAAEITDESGGVNNSVSGKVSNKSSILSACTWRQLVSEKAKKDCWCAEMTSSDGDGTSKQKNFEAESMMVQLSPPLNAKSSSDAEPVYAEKNYFAKDLPTQETNCKIKFSKDCNNPTPTKYHLGKSSPKVSFEKAKNFKSFTPRYEFESLPVNYRSEARNGFKTKKYKRKKPDRWSPGTDRFKRRARKRQLSQHSRGVKDSRDVLVCNTPSHSILDWRNSVNGNYGNYRNICNCNGYMTWPSNTYGFDTRLNCSGKDDNSKRLRGSQVFDLYIEKPLDKFHPRPLGSEPGLVVIEASSDDILLFKCSCENCIQSGAAQRNRKKTKQNKKTVVTQQATTNPISSRQHRKKTYENKSEKNNVPLRRRATSSGMWWLCLGCFDDHSSSSGSGGSDTDNGDDGDGGGGEKYVEHGEEISLDEDSDGGDSGSDSGGNESVNTAELFDNQINFNESTQGLGDGDGSDGGGSPGSDCSDSWSDVHSKLKKKRGSNGDDEDEYDDDDDDDDSIEDGFLDSFESVAIYEDK